MIDTRPSCPACGAVIADMKLHLRFHNAVLELARKVEAPGSSPEEYAQAIREEQEGNRS